MGSVGEQPEERWAVPDNWMWTSLSQLGDVVAGGTPSTKNPSFWGDEIRWISPADLTGYSAKTIERGAKSISKTGLANSSAKLMPAGSVHFSSRAPIGHIVISSEPLATNQGFKSLVPASGIFNEYVYYYLMASRDFARERASGTTFLELSGKAFGNLPVPLASTATQHRIVAKIEELFSELDKSVESLKKAREQLKVYRQAVLKHAFEGKLTTQWREENKDKLETPKQLLARIKQEREAHYEQQFKEWKATVVQWKRDGKRGKQPSKPHRIETARSPDGSEMNASSETPEGWKWVLFSALCSFENGDRGQNYPNKSEYVAKGIPWINAGHIDEDGSLSYERMHFITREKFETLRSGKIQADDIVYCLRGTIGKTALVEPLLEGAIASSLMIIRPYSPCDRRYIYNYLISPLGRQQIERFDNGSAQPNLSANSVSQYVLPLCSQAEQCEITRILERQFLAIEQNEREIDAALDRADSLRQSILKQAFSGQLVPQDPNDEPASKLLERIKAEKVATVRNNHSPKKRPQARATV